MATLLLCFVIITLVLIYVTGFVGTNFHNDHKDPENPKDVMSAKSIALRTVVAKPQPKGPSH